MTVTIPITFTTEPAQTYRLYLYENYQTSSNAYNGTSITDAYPLITGGGTFADILTVPLFWQVLGKACGWPRDNEPDMRFGEWEQKRCLGRAQQMVL